MKKLRTEHQVHFARGRQSRKVIQNGPQPNENTPTGHIPRISRLMALAIRFDRLIQEGHVTDQAELAQLGHVTRARVTQIMNLNNLAPDIQEALLSLPRTRHGRDPIRESMMRPLAAVSDWRKQRVAWIHFQSLGRHPVFGPSQVQPDKGCEQGSELPPE